MVYPLWRPHPASLPLKEIEGLIGYIEPNQGTDNDQQSINDIRALVLTPSDLANFWSVNIEQFSSDGPHPHCCMKPSSWDML
jgi:hypothetical protein